MLLHTNLAVFPRERDTVSGGWRITGGAVGTRSQILDLQANWIICTFKLKDTLKSFEWSCQAFVTKMASQNMCWQGIL